MFIYPFLSDYLAFLGLGGGVDGSRKGAFGVHFSKRILDLNIRTEPTIELQNDISILLPKNAHEGGSVGGGMKTRCVMPRFI
jgi:hypothetical protein